MRWLLLILLAVGCATDGYDDKKLKARLAALELHVDRYCDEDLLSALAIDPRLNFAEQKIQRLQWAHPEITEWGPLK